MRIFFPVTAIFVISLFLSLSAQYPAQVKIMTYNIQSENATHKEGDYSDIAAVISDIQPNICGLQKVDSFTVTTMDVLEYLGDETQMVPTFSMSYEKNDGSYGNGFLSDSVPNNSRRLAIPKGSASEDRSALEIGITMGGERVRVIVTHLGYDNDAVRITQLDQILPWIDKDGMAAVPVVIMADFNAKPTANSMKKLTDAGFEFVKGNDGQILDTSAGQGINHILYRPAARWRINDAGNPKYTASNRNPVWADMELLNPVIRTCQPLSRQVMQVLSLNFINGKLYYSLSQPSIVSCELFTINGRYVQTLIAPVHQVPGSRKFSVSMSDQATGVYQAIFSINGIPSAHSLLLCR